MSRTKEDSTANALARPAALVQNVRPMGTAPDLSVIIVSWNCRDVLMNCLRSLPGGAGSIAIETIVVDNHSADGSAEAVSREFSDVALIANESNRGFAAANNQAIAIARGRHVLLLNPDTVVEDGALATLAAELDADESIGALGPTLLGANGANQPSVRVLPSFRAFCDRYTPLRALKVFRRAYERYKVRQFDYSAPADVASLVGAAIAIPRRVLAEVGLLDERFFLYFEETDLCRRIAEAGYRVRYTPAARITHIGNVSAAESTPGLLYRRSMFQYLAKHGGRQAQLKVHALRTGMFCQELLQLIYCLGAAAVLAAACQFARAKKKYRRFAGALRFVCRDGWRTF